MRDSLDVQTTFSWVTWIRLWFPIPKLARNIRLRIFESAYGRREGWYVKRDGRHIAELTDGRYEHDFWESYRIVPLDVDPEDSKRLFTNAFWDDTCNIEFISKEFLDTAPFAFPSINPIRLPERIMMRGLYLVVAPPTPWERIILFGKHFIGKYGMAKKNDGNCSVPRA